MKKLILVAAVMGLAIPSTAFASFRDCDLLSGQPVSCDGFYEGSAVLQDHNTYRECTFREGKITHCGRPFDGRAIVSVEGIFKTCEMAEGKIYRCVGWAQGHAPSWKADDGAADPIFPSERSMTARVEKAKALLAAPVKAANVNSKATAKVKTVKTKKAVKTAKK